MSRAEVVATGSIELRASKKNRVVKDEELRQRAEAACPLGTATCKFAEVRLTPHKHGNDTTVKVEALCHNERNCGNNDENLQRALGRLEVQLATYEAR